MDFVEICKDWLNFTMSPRTGHLLSFPWLFPEGAIVTCFRAINFITMFKSFEKSVMMTGLISRMSVFVNGPQKQLFDRLHVPASTFLVLEIRRDNILRDALNQLWRRQKRELHKPLKVRMGMQEGEEGVDMGGVQQEFFRLAIADALDPAHGLFTVDERTKMTWFCPASPTPLYHYVLVGMLFGLAVYNGITLPVTFPLAFYRKLLQMPVTTLEHVTDGWPSLAKGLRSLLDWSDGPVEDVFMRSYVFSFESFGLTRDIDMLRHKREDAWPPKEKTGSLDITSGDDKELSEWTSISAASPTDTERNHETPSEPEMVTNENRQKYVLDYIYWLTDKSIAPQFTAFSAGFYLPLQKKSLQLFTPEALRTLIEGIQEIDVEALEHTTRYEDGYSPGHPTIINFWEVVRNLSPTEHKQLLEFVTASPRVPVRGVEEIVFVIQRNGVGDERLPTSMTCFGRLLLPEYSSKDLLAKKLKLAIENSQGFGTQ
jgi:hypothetical protein